MQGPTRVQTQNLSETEKSQWGSDIKSQDDFIYVIRLFIISAGSLCF